MTAIALQKKLNNLYTEKTFDIIINNINFHKAVLDLWLPPKILEMNDLEKLSQDTLSLLKNIFYGQEEQYALKDDEHLPFYIFQDKYQLELYEFINNTTSMDLFIYLLEFCNDRDFVYRIFYNITGTGQTTDKIITPEIKYCMLYYKILTKEAVPQLI